MHISQDDFLMFVDRALDGMLQIVEALGDDRCHLIPDLPGANSPYAILFHCVGLTHFWIGTFIAGRHVERDRTAEFRARGSVSEIRKMVKDLKHQLRADLLHVQGDKPLSQQPPAAYTPLPEEQGWTQSAVLIHTFEELAQHHGQMELSRDMIMRRESGDWDGDDERLLDQR